MSLSEYKRVLVFLGTAVTKFARCRLPMLANKFVSIVSGLFAM